MRTPVPTAAAARTTTRFGRRTRRNCSTRGSSSAEPASSVQTFVIGYGGAFSGGVPTRLNWIAWGGSGMTSVAGDPYSFGTTGAGDGDALERDSHPGRPGPLQHLPGRDRGPRQGDPAAEATGDHRPGCRQRRVLGRRRRRRRVHHRLDLRVRRPDPARSRARIRSTPATPTTALARSRRSGPWPPSPCPGSGASSRPTRTTAQTTPSSSGARATSSGAACPTACSRARSPATAPPAATPPPAQCVFNQLTGNAEEFNIFSSSAAIKRRIYTTTQNGYFGVNVDNLISVPPTAPFRVAIWPPQSASISPSVAPNDYITQGLFDREMGLPLDSSASPATDFANLQTWFKACAGSNLPAACGTAGLTQMKAARREAREMHAGLPGRRPARARDRRDPAARPAGANAGSILYKARSWILSEATLATSAVAGPPLQNEPELFTRGVRPLPRRHPRLQRQEPRPGRHTDPPGLRPPQPGQGRHRRTRNHSQRQPHEPEARHDRGLHGSQRRAARLPRAAPTAAPAEPRARRPAARSCGPSSPTTSSASSSIGTGTSPRAVPTRPT